MSKAVIIAWGFLFDHETNPLRHIPDLNTRHMVLQILGWMWPLSFSIANGSYTVFAISTIGHAVLIGAAAITVATYSAAEAAARRAPDARKRLDLQLARNNLGWAEAKVVWGNPKNVLGEIVRNWEPDLVVACAGQLPYGVADGADVLSVARRSLFGRLAEMLLHPAPRQA